MKRQTIISATALAGLGLIAFGAALNAYVLTRPGIEGGPTELTLSLETAYTLTFKSDHPGFSLVLIGFLMLAAAFGATFLSGRYRISN